MARRPAPRSPMQQSWRQSVSAHDAWDRIVLLIAFAIGIGGGIALKLAGVHPFWSAGFSAAVLCAYAGITYATTPLRLEPEAIGDNCYYLGFLFTLTSLSVTLYFVVEAGEADRAQLIPEVISGFGVALSSTIMGVFLRVLMMQFRVDIVSREKETRLEMDMQAREVRDAMARSVRQIKSFTLESLQHAQEREDAMRLSSEAVIAQIENQLSHVVGIVTESLRDSASAQGAAAVTAIRDSLIQTSDDLLGSAKAAFATIGTDLGEAHAARLRATSELSRSTEAVEKACLRMAEQADQLAAALDRAADRLSQRADLRPDA